MIEQVPQVNQRKSQRRPEDQSKLAPVQPVPKSPVKQVLGLQSEAEVRCIHTGEAPNVQLSKMR